MIIIIAIIIGIVMGLLVPYNLNAQTLQYIAVAIIAVLDSVFGAVLANYEKRFNLVIFLTGLSTNAILAVALTFVGNILGIDMSFASVIVFGTRIFNNLAKIRYHILDKYFEKKNYHNPKIEVKLLSEADEERKELDEEFDFDLDEVTEEKE